MPKKRIDPYFKMFIQLMMVFYAVGVGAYAVEGKWSAIAEMTVETFRDFLLIAIAIFRGVFFDDGEKEETNGIQKDSGQGGEVRG